jgi:hypothetical protein
MKQRGGDATTPAPAPAPTPDPAATTPAPAGTEGGFFDTITNGITKAAGAVTNAAAGAAAAVTGNAQPAEEKKEEEKKVGGKGRKNKTMKKTLKRCVITKEKGSTLCKRKGEPKSHWKWGNKCSKKRKTIMTKACCAKGKASRAARKLINKM